MGGRVLQFVSALFAILSVASAAFASDMTVYAIDPCGGCRTAQGADCGQCTVMNELFFRYEKLLSEGSSGRALVLRNMLKETEAYQERGERLEALGFNARGISIPTVIIDEAVFSGNGAQDALIVKYLQTGEYYGYIGAEEATAGEKTVDSSTVVYFRSPYCGDCVKMSQWLTVNLPDGVDLTVYDISQEEGMLAYQESARYFGRTEAEMVTPTIVYGETLLVGRDEIHLRLLSRIEEEPEAELPAFLCQGA